MRSTRRYKDDNSFWPREAQAQPFMTHEGNVMQCPDSLMLTLRKRREREIDVSVSRRAL